MIRRFKPGWGLTLLMAVLAAVFVGLGQWQLERKAEKAVLFEQFENAPETTLPVGLDSAWPYARIRARGRFDSTRHILLDNRIHKGRAGVQVLTPFHSASGTTVLVNRGWLPIAPDRLSLPEFDTASDETEIQGLLVHPPEPGPRLGEPPAYDIGSWPLLITWFDAAVVEQALGEPLPHRIVLLDSRHDAGFEGRDWSPAVMPAATHGAYAFQWFSLALAALIIWLILGFRRTT